MAKKLVLLNGRIADHKVDEGGRATAAHVLGTRAVDDVGNMYRYVQCKDLAIDQYDAVSYKTATIDFTVTQDISASSDTRPAGVYSEATQVAVDEYFWLQTSGVATVNSENAGALVVGDTIILDAAGNNDGEVAEVDVASATTVAAGIAKAMGTVLATEVAGSPDTTSVLLKGLL